MLHMILPALLSLQAPAAQSAPPVETPKVQALKPLGFFSKKFPYQWDVLLPLETEVDGLKLDTIFFNRREIRSWPLKGAEFGTRAQIAVTNTAEKVRVPNFAVAVFDDEGRLLGVATGGSRLTGVKPGKTETFDLNFSRIRQRLPKGTHFVLSLEFSE
jgi:hypothetical protein